MVWLHVVYDEAVYRSPLKDKLQLMHEDVRVTYIHRINEGRLLIYNQVGVICHTIGQAPHVLKESLHAVIHTDVVYGVGDLRYLIHSA